MKSSIKVLLLLIGFCTSAGLALQAQEEAAATYYSQMDYMYVAPGMHGEYEALEAAWKKIHQANVDAGRYDIWTLSQVMTPNGSASSHNYVTRIGYRGEAQMAAAMTGNIFPDNIEELLSAEEMALVERTSEIRKWVKSEVFSTQEFIRQEDMEANVTVFNYFSYPEGAGRSDHFKVERDYWMAIHQARIDAGEMEGWVLLNKELPYGAAQPYHSATVDVYESLEEFLTADPRPYFDAIHGDKMEAIFEETDASATLILGEVRISLDRTTPMSR
ncbi:MAG: hypothetical protein AAF433_01500 [Bacteroidota bacterium]